MNPPRTPENLEPPHQNTVGICGWKNSGKTTLIEKVIPRLREKGLTVAVIKHDSHGIEVDRPGKDSDRFFQAGADVLLQGTGEEMLRRRIQDSGSLNEWIARLAPRYDLVLVEGRKHTPLPKVWLSDGGDPPPKEAGENILLSLLPHDDRAGKLMRLIEERLKAQCFGTPLLGCILIGGKSRRMGTPKHLLQDKGRTWIEQIVQQVGAVASEVVIAGEGELPGALNSLTRLPDAPDVRGPMAGILAAIRWNPRVSWLVAACDMPLISRPALEWLLGRRMPGAWAVMPRIRDLEKEVQPLLAYYDFRAGTILESAAGCGDFALNPLSAHEKVTTPEPPEALARAWKNINSAEDLQEYRSSLDLDH